MDQLRTIAIASDHAGFELKAILKDHMQTHLGVQVLDLGTDSTKSVDYPDYAKLLAEAVVSGKAERGIVLCGSGVGVSIAANKIRGAKAGLCHDCYSAHQGVEHDHMNILALGARVIGEELAKELVGIFLKAKQSQEPRHLRRIQKVEDLEQD